MSQTLSIRLLVEELRSLSYTGISDTYAALGSPYAYPIRMYHIQNFTNTNIIWSWDGVTDHGIIATGGFLLLDIATNKSLPQGLYLPEGGQTYIRAFTGVIPTSGSVCLTTFYGNPN